MLNIGAENAGDAFHRYRMPALVTRIEGRGNGIKTNVVNNVDIAKALERPPEYVLKFYGCELGAQTKFDKASGTSIVNGSHDSAKLAELLEGFIKKYVQCYSCGNPETKVVITRSQCIHLRCAACGFVSEVDMRDKLTTFILNHPPEAKEGEEGDRSMRRAERERIKAGEALDEEEKRSKKEGAGKKKTKKSSADGQKKKKVSTDDGAEKGDDECPESSERKDDGDEDDDVEWQTDTSAEAAQQRIQEQLTAATASLVMVSAAESPESEPVPDSPKLNGVSLNREATDVEKSEHDVLVEELRDYLQTHNLAEFAEYVSKKDLNAELYIALVEALVCNVSRGYAKEIMRKKAVLSGIVDGTTAQRSLLQGVEHFFALKAGAAAKEVALVLKALYDEEVLDDEEVIFEWEKLPNCPGVDAKQAATVRKLSAPFIDWLKEAEEDDE